MEPVNALAAKMADEAVLRRRLWFPDILWAWPSWSPRDRPYDWERDGGATGGTE
jgi:hypothetical protein